MFLQQTGKELLGQVLRIMRGVALSSNVSIKGIQVSAAEFFESRVRFGRRAVARGQDDAPMRGGKPLPLLGRHFRFLLVLHHKSMPGKELYLCSLSAKGEPGNFSAVRIH